MRQQAWWRGGLAVLALGLVVGLYACSEKEPETAAVPSVKQVYDAGVAAMREGDVQKALSAFTLISTNTPKGSMYHARAEVFLGEMAVRSGNIELGIEKFEQAIQENPNLIQARMSLGNALFSANRPQEAMEVWEQVIQITPNMSAVHNNLGVAYMDRGDLDQALHHLERTVALAPDNVRAQRNLAQLYRKKGMADAADATEKRLAARLAGASDPAQGAATAP